EVALESKTLAALLYESYAMADQQGRFVALRQDPPQPLGLAGPLGALDERDPPLDSVKGEVVPGCHRDVAPRQTVVDEALAVAEELLNRPCVPVCLVVRGGLLHFLVEFEEVVRRDLRAGRPESLQAGGAVDSLDPLPGRQNERAGVGVMVERAVHGCAEMQA